MSRTLSLLSLMFLIALMNNEGLSKHSYSEMLQQQSTLKDSDLLRQMFGLSGFGLGIALKPYAGTVNYWHSGNNWGYTSSFIINKEKKFGYVFFTNADQCNDLIRLVEAFLWE